MNSTHMCNNLFGVMFVDELICKLSFTTSSGISLVQWMAIKATRINETLKLSKIVIAGA